VAASSIRPFHAVLSSAHAGVPLLLPAQSLPARAAERRHPTLRAHGRQIGHPHQVRMRSGTTARPSRWRPELTSARPSGSDRAAAGRQRWRCRGMVRPYRSRGAGATPLSCRELA